MPDLIDRLLLLSCKRSILANSILFQKVSDFIARSEEIIVSNVILIVRREFSHRMIIDIEFIQQLFGTSEECICLFRG